VFLISSAFGAIAAPAFAQDAGAQTAQRSFSIPAQSLTDALPLFGQQSGLQVSANGDLVRGVSTNGVSGSMAPGEALSQLLAGTGLTFRISDSTVTIERAPQVTGGAMQLGPVRVQGANYMDPGRTEGSKSYVAPEAKSSFGMPLTLRETP